MSRRFLVAPWGPSNGAEIENARIAANRLQSVFRFEPSVAIDLDTTRYAIGHSRYDLDRAARNLLRRKHFKDVQTGQLILLTSLPYSEPGAALHGLDDLNDGLYFLDDAVSSAGKTLAIVSTYVWEHLPDDASIPALTGAHGWRALEPYLLYAYAMVALGQRLDLEYHRVTRGCPYDYNLDVRSIDLFFKWGKFCEDCEREIARVTEGNLRLNEELGAIRTLLNVAAGRPPSYKYKFALSFSGRDRHLAERLAEHFTAAGLSIFYDDHNPQELVGKNLREYFQRVFGLDSEYCIILVSEAYVKGPWTTHEREMAQDRAMRERDKEYILPVMIEDNVRLPGMSDDVGYLPLSKYSIEEIAEILVRKASA